MAVPKRRRSRSKQKSRVAANRWHAPLFQPCGNCGAPVPGHVACPACGVYRGRQVFNVEL